SWGATCAASFASGAAVAFTATPAAGSTFTGWSGGCSGTGTCTDTLSGCNGLRHVLSQRQLHRQPPDRDDYGRRVHARHGAADAKWASEPDLSGAGKDRADLHRSDARR